MKYKNISPRLPRWFTTRPNVFSLPRPISVSVASRAFTTRSHWVALLRFAFHIFSGIRHSIYGRRRARRQPWGNEPCWAITPTHEQGLLAQGLKRAKKKGPNVGPSLMRSIASLEVAWQLGHELLIHHVRLNAVVEIDHFREQLLCQKWQRVFGSSAASFISIEN